VDPIVSAAPSDCVTDSLLQRDVDNIIQEL